jgi:hypothetical protein
MPGEKADVVPASKWPPRLRRLGFGLLTGMAITSLPFLVMMKHKELWKMNYLLAPGGIVAIILGFMTHYCENCYVATLLTVNVLIYGALVYACASLPILRRHSKPGR